MVESSATVFVLGATGPAGICLLRELAFQGYHAVVYARSPNKIPEELASNPLLTIVKGEMDDVEAVKKAMAPCSAVLSLLGPSFDNKNIEPSLFADIYRNTIFPAMKEANIKRIIAMGTVSISRPEDAWTLFQATLGIFMRLAAGKIYKNMQNLAATFEKDGQGLDWTLFRIAMIPGESDHENWSKDRESGKVYAGKVGGQGWTSSIPRAVLTKWMVDHVGSEDWNGKMPALSKAG